MPLPRLLEHLQDRHLISDHLAEFLNAVLDTASTAAIFGNPEQPDQPWSLATRPERPPAKAMIQFLPGRPGRCDMDTPEGIASFMGWHRHLRPIVERLEAALGQSVYEFRDFDDEHDDDYGHRFLVLYCCGLYQPESDYVKFLLEACGAEMSLRSRRL